MRLKVKVTIEGILMVLKDILFLINFKIQSLKRLNIVIFENNLSHWGLESG